MTSVTVDPDLFYLRSLHLRSKLDGTDYDTDYDTNRDGVSLEEEVKDAQAAQGGAQEVETEDEFATGTDKALVLSVLQTVLGEDIDEQTLKFVIKEAYSRIKSTWDTIPITVNQLAAKSLDIIEQYDKPSADEAPGFETHETDLFDISNNSDGTVSITNIDATGLFDILNNSASTVSADDFKEVLKLILDVNGIENVDLDSIFANVSDPMDESEFNTIITELETISGNDLFISGSTGGGTGGGTSGGTSGGTDGSTGESSKGNTQTGLNGPNIPEYSFKDNFSDKEAVENMFETLASNEVVSTDFAQEFLTVYLGDTLDDKKISELIDTADKNDNDVLSKDEFKKLMSSVNDALDEIDGNGNGGKGGKGKGGNRND